MSVTVEMHGAVAELCLDWPEVRNAMGPEEAAELRGALVSQSDAAAIVISANGGAFCAGGNLPAIIALANRGADVVRETVYSEFQALFRTLRSATAPVLSAVDGPAVGFGCDLALAGALTFIGAKGWLAQGWAKAGLVPATGGALYAIERGGRQALWRLLSEDRLTGQVAESLGLAIACDSARDAALAAAARLAALPRATVKAMCTLATIQNEDAHLAAALDYQVGFLTDPAFKQNAERLLHRS